MWKPLNLDDDMPLYLAIANAVERDIGEGRLVPGERMPTQRELAAAVGVDLSTVTRAYAESSRRGLITATVGRGTFVSADVGVFVPLMRGGPPELDLIEMGLVLPLYSLEKETATAVQASIASADLEPYLRYCEPRGMAEHRAVGAQWLRRYGIETGADNILVASGTQNGLVSVLMALLKPGDRLAVEALTYPGLKTAASMLGIKLVPIAMDSSGLRPDDLEAACGRGPIRALYLMPELQNPTTAALPEERRSAVLDIVRRRGLILLEDDTYADARDDRRPALSSRAPESSIFFGGISKIFGAGLRVSFVAAPSRFVGAIERAILASVWMAPPLSAMIVSRIIQSGDAERILESKKIEARRRSALTLKLLAASQFHCPPVGFFGWLELPSSWTGKEFELEARAAGVRLFCAEKFAVGDQSPAAVRLSLSGPATIDELARGLDLVSGILARGRRADGPVF